VDANHGILLVVVVASPDGSGAEGPVRAVVFDVGETLVDETSAWASWADWLGVPQLTFMGVFGATIERGEHLLRALEHFRPGFDLRAELEARALAGDPVELRPEDLYPDALPCLREIRKRPAT
jgi:beta-phosphoglucomutase-like phosphatase (HAD superfamily)